MILNANNRAATCKMNAATGWVTRAALDACCMPPRACEDDCMPTVTLFGSQ